MNFTQPICAHCYAARYPGRVPVTIKPEFREREVCCDCGQPTEHGIYYRVDPRRVPYPTPEEEEA